MDYDITIPFNTVIYHGSDKHLNELHNIPIWATMKEDHSKPYGDVINTFTTNTALKLINVMHPTFHSDFIHSVYSNDRLVFKDKCLILAPLGLPSFDTQMMYLNKLPGGVYEWKDDAALKLTLDLHIPFVNGKHRYSIKMSELDLDLNMVDYLKDEYPQYDGYIAPTYWPSYHHGGFLVPEVCIFDSKRHLTLSLGLAKGGQGKKGTGRKQVVKSKDVASFYGGTNMQGDIQTSMLRAPFKGIDFDPFRKINEIQYPTPPFDFNNLKLAVPTRLLSA